MKKSFLIIAMLVGSLTFAHEVSYEQKKEVYNFINTQLEEGKINLETAQSMWKVYIRCCKEDL